MIGFEDLKERLRISSKNSNIAHAHMIAGPDGIGKSVFSRDLARIILYPEKEDYNKNYVDIIEIRNDKNSIGIDEVRKIVAEANVKPFEADRKVIMIFEAHKMTVQAQNALLKTLEEPSPGVFFILITDSEEKLLMTIRSRVQIHRLTPLSKKDMSRYIDENYSLSSEKKEEAIAIALGIPGNAARFIEDESYREYLDFVFNFLEDTARARGIRDRSCIELLDKNKKILRYDLVDFFNTTILASRDLLLLKAGQDYKKLIFLYNKNRLENLSQKFAIKRLNHIIEVMQKGLFLTEPGKNINKETIIDYILFRLLEEIQ